MQTKIEAPAPEPLSLGQTAVAASGVGRTYRSRRKTVAALEGVDLDVRAGEVVAVVGPSGCGKSTLDAGEIEGGGLEQCAFMPQRDLLLPWRDGLGNAALALECKGARRAEARRAAAPLFERFGLAEFERSYPRELSGGMRQRVAFLRTLLAGRPVLLLDEPFAALDSITRASMQEWLADALASERRTVVLVTHDVEEALFLADRVAVMSPRPGRILASLPVPFTRPRPRRETVTSPAFAELKERALEALGQ